MSTGMSIVVAAAGEKTGSAGKKDRQCPLPAGKRLQAMRQRDCIVAG
jgi:hypothetical protein